MIDEHGRNEARELFQSLGLTYKDITLGRLRYLEILLNDQFNLVARKCMNGERRKPRYWVRVNSAKYYKGKYDENGSLVYAFMTGKGTYFEAREVISFNRNGFIGFCCEADDENTQPVLTAFREWCVWLKKRSEHDETR